MSRATKQMAELQRGDDRIDCAGTIEPEAAGSIYYFVEFKNASES